MTALHDIKQVLANKAAVIHRSKKKQDKIIRTTPIEDKLVMTMLKKLTALIGYKLFEPGILVSGNQYLSAWRTSFASLVYISEQRRNDLESNDRPGPCYLAILDHKSPFFFQICWSTTHHCIKKEIDRSNILYNTTELELTATH